MHFQSIMLKYLGFVWPDFPLDPFVTFDASVVIDHVTYGLRSLPNSGFAAGCDQTFAEEILVSYLWLFWGLISELKFCKKSAMYVFRWMFVILGHLGCK